MRAAAEGDLGTGPYGFLHQAVDIVDRADIDQRADADAVAKAITHRQLGGGLDQFRHEFIVDPVLHQHAVRADAGLAGVAVLGNHRTLDRGVEVGVIEDDKGRVAAQFHRGLLHGFGTLGLQHLAHRGGTGEGQLAHDGVAGELAADRRGAAGDDIQHACGNARALCQYRHGKGRQRCLAGGFDHDAAARGQGRCRLARDHGIGEVPGGDRGDHAHRLLDADNAPVRRGPRNDIAVDTLGFLAEPLDERGAVGHFAARFCQHLALLGGHDTGEVLLVFHHQVEPLAQNLRALFCRHDLPAVHGGLRGFDRAPGLGCANPGHLGNDLTVGGVAD